ncbi:MAG: hypothetical protein HYV07_05285 [Deltaproteobacteria bacterium]|nr:hypothetical protein [Deltaproteobacteria bacterium]
MIPGLNHNVRYRDRVFHVQTEDKGLEKTLLTTHVFIEGSVIAERHESYFDLHADKLEINARNAAVRKRMQNLHKDCMKALLRGDFDETIFRLGVMPRPEPGLPEPGLLAEAAAPGVPLFPPGFQIGGVFMGVGSPVHAASEGSPSAMMAAQAPIVIEPEPITGPLTVSSVPAVNPGPPSHAARAMQTAEPSPFAPPRAPSTDSASLARGAIQGPDAFSPESTVIAARPPRRDLRPDDFGAEPTIIAARPPRSNHRMQDADVTEPPTLVGVSLRGGPDLANLFPNGLPALDALPPIGASDPGTPDLPLVQPVREPSFADDLVLPREPMGAPPPQFTQEAATDLLRRPNIAPASAFALDPTELGAWNYAIPPSPIPDITMAPSVRAEELDVEVDIVEDDDALSDLEVVVDEPPIELGPEAVVDEATATSPGAVMLPSFGPRPEIRKLPDRPSTFTRLPTMPPPAADMKELFHRISKPVPGSRPTQAVRIPERSLDDIILGYLSGEREKK